MVSSLVQTPTIKINSEFVNRATEIIDRFYEQIDKCCPACQALLKSKSGLGNQPNTNTDDTTNPVTNRNRHV